MPSARAWSCSGSHRCAAGTELRALGTPGAARPEALGGAIVGVAVLMALGIDTRLQTKVPATRRPCRASRRARPPRAASTISSADAARSPGRDELDDFGVAPEFAGSASGSTRSRCCSNRSAGKVVLIDFWTYSCINCLRTPPYLTRWDETYRDDGLVIVGVHTPEFAFEREPGNVRAAIAELGIEYPVALDPDYATWDAWWNRYWPAEYFVDRPWPRPASPTSARAPTRRRRR